MYILTIDAGTTNTRVTLWHKDQPQSIAVREVGVRDTATDGHNSKLKIAIKDAITEVLAGKRLTLENISQIIATGMITSNVGLVEVPHLIAPVGIEELARGIVAYRFPEIIDKEILFVPGVKNHADVRTLEDKESMDIMRGEEVEVVGLIERLNLAGPAVVILPGSHSKFISLDKNNKITGCVTSLAGELISLITKGSILASSLSSSFAKELDKELLIQGFEAGTRYGLTRGSFMVRILDRFTELTDNQKANFLLGVILSDDLKALKNSTAIKVSSDSLIIIAGKEILKDALEVVILEDGFFKNIRKASKEEANHLAGFGALCVSKRSLKEMQP
ncbi:2-dehydro-3-deoxygalactonokinase [Planomicrobium sp. CPCC 101079]|uniref:2-dehydro-3-deoxygalactonokinase n=1 Tax=Planomicrobium sp. CPCC 101079 TaxID=2599618 RepID=UPI0011B5C996|nr:2-dehydro-3-deoxygalactonokinase [Planomicrobium sp. CPCC 101079]TWT01770.1 2-dehydro-3-deoxygalactonokinase [Planomicrobium sp. CPCC 101079]